MRFGRIGKNARWIFGTFIMMCLMVKLHRKSNPSQEEKINDKNIYLDDLNDYIILPENNKDESSTTEETSSTFVFDVSSDINTKDHLEEKFKTFYTKYETLVSDSDTTPGWHFVNEDHFVYEEYADYDVIETENKYFIQTNTPKIGDEYYLGTESFNTDGTDADIDVTTEADIDVSEADIDITEADNQYFIQTDFPEYGKNKNLKAELSPTAASQYEFNRIEKEQQDNAVVNPNSLKHLEEILYNIEYMVQENMNLNAERHDDQHENSNSNDQSIHQSRSLTDQFKHDIGPLSRHNERISTLRRACGSDAASNDENIYPPIIEAHLARYHQLVSDKTFLEHIIVDDAHKTLFCYVPKVACTNWKRLMKVLSGRGGMVDPSEIDKQFIHTHVGLTMLDSFMPKDIINRLHHYTKFLFVRDPMERLVSAYRDKFGDDSESGPGYLELYGPFIQGLYRPKSSVNKNGHGTTFKEFSRYVIDTSLNDLDQSDDHWELVTKLCRPCEISYDFIGKLETVDEDTHVILSAIGADSTLKLPAPDVESVPQDVEHYMGQLSLDMRGQLQQVYARDYEAFGYDYRIYTEPPPTNSNQRVKP